MPKEINRTSIDIQELYEPCGQGFRFYVRDASSPSNPTVKYFIPEHKMMCYGLTLISMKEIIRDYCARYGVIDGLERLTNFLEDTM